MESGGTVVERVGEWHQISARVDCVPTCGRRGDCNRHR